MKSLQDESSNSVSLAIRNQAPSFPFGDNIILCDGGLDLHSGGASIACVLLSNCLLIDGFGLRVEASSALASEAWALRSTLLLAHVRGLHQVWFGLDCKLVIDSILSDHDPPLECAPFISDIKNLSLGNNFSFNFVPRSFNSIAHWVAREARHGSLRPD